MGVEERILRRGEPFPPDPPPDPPNPSRDPPPTDSCEFGGVFSCEFGGVVSILFRAFLLTLCNGVS